MKTKPQKIKHLWTMICQGSVIDSLSNNISLYGVLEQVQVGKRDSSGKNVIPGRGEGVPLNFQVIALWKRLLDLEGRTFSIEGELQVIDPEGTVLMQQITPIVMEQGKERMRTIMQFQGFKVTVPGEYVFRTRIREDEKEDFIDVDESYLVIQFALK